jgi:methyltransferase (TIGR00027 family)
MKENKPSRTAEWVAFLRGLGTLEERPIAPDPIAVRLVGEPLSGALRLLEKFPRGVRRVTRLADALSGGRGRHMALRTRAIDDQVIAAVDGGATQLVLLGAGLDARADRLDALAKTAVFEVDHPATQGWKRAHVEGLSPKARSVTHVAVNFEREDWRTKLLAAGYDESQKAVFVWEGVTMYLTREAIDLTLESIRRSAAGTRLLATYSTPRASTANRLMPLVVKLAGEPFRTNLTPAEARRLVEQHGFKFLGDDGDAEWAARYLNKSIAESLERLIACERI